MPIELMLNIDMKTKGKQTFFHLHTIRDSQKESDTKDSPTRLSNQSDNKVFQYSQNAQREQKRFEQNRLNFSKTI